MVASKNFAGATIRPGVEDAVNPSLEASWRHPRAKTSTPGRMVAPAKFLEVP
ncbi:hypothetical protein HH1059_01190 [Halorhodospira halochloris]|uniref:Uncharacterized protein n=1 Tax=Halorhodospira halochloris TaxID=1052 RepID=A0A2Z6EZ76_HALHR|nr:hypothetical protein HH1059_01190 [Halorhodospira halochloris]